MTFDIRRLDIYRKIPKDLTQPTITGALISIFCVVFIALLFLSEFFHFISVDVTNELFVDNPGGTDRIVVRINITLPRLPCEAVGLDIQDDMGRHEVGYVQDTVKVPLDDNKGCRFEGRFLVNKVPGNFHVSTHSASRQPDNIDMSHIVHDLSLGDDMVYNVKGSFNPIRGSDKQDAKSHESHDYIMKVVPTVYQAIDGITIHTYQYTAVHRSYVSMSHIGQIIPAIWFRYDLTPITVKYTERRPPFYTFLTSACAIIGGTFTVAGILDSLIFTASSLFHKLQLGKVQ